MRVDRRPEESGTGASRRLTIDPPPEDRAVVRFATFELFVLIYLQKFAVGQGKFQINVIFFFMLFGLAWMILTGRITFSRVRLGLYLIFVGCCLFSSLLINGIGSVPSITELILLYSFFTVSAPLSEAGYHRVLDNFMRLMIVPAIIVIFQFGIQRITGHADPIVMDHFLPKSILMRGYVYNANYPNWDSPFQRANGFFFLEPSFASFFMASAVIIEIMFFRRPFFLILMSLATALTQGGTGITMLMLASPFLLARESPRIVLPLGVIAIVGILGAYLAGVQLPLISRLGELDTNTVGGGYNSSGALRLIIPWTRLVDVLSDPTYVFTGSGAGSTRPTEGSPWPILKISLEYGILTMISFSALVASVFIGKHNVPMKFAGWIVFNFTGGYLLDPDLIITFSLLFCLIEPIENAGETDVQFQQHQAPAERTMNRRLALRPDAATGSTFAAESDRYRSF